MAFPQTPETSLATVARALVAPGKGVLAADESVNTMKKRLDPIGVPSTLENRSLWREIISNAPGIEAMISGIILFDETLRQPMSNGQMLVELLQSKNIYPGIKVDKGTVALNAREETFTQGLDDLTERLNEYKAMGAAFAKWRAVYTVSEAMPSTAAITANSIGLAEYAVLCQRAGLVPIVEPEVFVLEGGHDLRRSQEVTERVLKDVFYWLHQCEVELPAMLLKPNMVLPGKQSASQASAEDIARATVETLLATVPKEVPGIVFLSGGLSPDQATEYLGAMNSLYSDLPWQLSFSFGRALQQEALQAWGGKAEHVKECQDVFISRAQKVSLARGAR